MARNKRLQDREEKQKEILNVARDLFLNEGYDLTSMNRIATLTGVAPNTIYWYFEDKDELLVTILNSELTQGFLDYVQIQDYEITERLMWVIEQLELLKQLVSTVHSRLNLSENIYIWHERFHLLVENLLRQELKLSGLAEERIEAKVKIAVFTIEGILTHQLTTQEKFEVCCELLK